MSYSRAAFVKVGFGWIQPLAHLLPNEILSLPGIKFRKEYLTSKGLFEVVLIVHQVDLTKLPLVYVINKPDCFENQALPHIRNDGFLCYANNDQTEWDPNEPNELARWIDDSIFRTISLAVKNSDRYSEYEHEFSNYWDGQFSAYCFNLISDNDGVFNYRSYLAIKNSKNNECKEFVIYDDVDDCNHWLAIRNAYSTSEEGRVIIVNVRKNNWAPSSGWPPNSLSEVLEWLVKSDRSARDYLVSKLVELSQKKSFYCCKNN